MHLRLSNERLLAMLIALPSMYLYLSLLAPYFTPFSNVRVILYPLAYCLGVIGYIRCVRYQKCFFVFGAILLIILLNIMIFPHFWNYFADTSTSSGIWLSDLLIFSLISVPGLLLGLSASNLERILYELFRFGIIILIMFILTFFIIVFLFNSSFDYMNVSYGVVPWMLLSWGYAKKEKIKICMILCVCAFFFVCIAGCRGAAITSLVYLFLEYIFTMDKKFSLKKIVIILIVFISLIVISINLQAVVSLLYSFLSQLGFKSRTLELYLGIGYEKGLAHYSDRLNIQKPLLNNLNLFGHGLYGDRLLTGTGQYAHNLFLEWLIDFGILFGFIVSLYFIFLVIKGIVCLVKCNKIENKIIICTSLSILCCKYMVSASYLHMPEFWILIGLLITSIKVNNNTQRI